MGSNIIPNRLSGVLASLAVALVAVGALASSPAHASACDLYAAPTGNDNAEGTLGAPFRTAQKLVDSLDAGQTGCLAAGATFVEDLRIDRDGTPGGPIRLTGQPGPAPTVRGRMLVLGDHVEVVGLALDGRNAADLPSPTVIGDDVVFRGNDVTNHHTEICFNIGSDSSDPPFYGFAHRTILDGNRIHNCGELPATNLDHGIYVVGAYDTAITNNYIYDNADRGIQLFPDSHRTLIANNIIDGNGQNVAFGGWNGLSSSNNVVRDNVISNAKIRANVESWWGEGSSPGVGNVVTSNCVWNGVGGNFSGSGFRQTANYEADPRFGSGFAIAPFSPCAVDGPDPATVVAPPPSPAPPVGSVSGSFADEGPLGGGGSAPARARVARIRTSLTSGEVVSGKVAWSASVTGAKTSRVDFLVDGRLVWTERSAPFSVNGDRAKWDTATLKNGRHRLVVRARSGRRVVAKTSAQVVVRNGSDRARALDRS